MIRPAPIVDERPARRLAPFLITPQHRRLTEFADTVRRHRYIGACYGAPGIRKTLSARTYAAADDFDRWEGDRFMRKTALPSSLLASRTATFTPSVIITPRELDREIRYRCGILSDDIERTFHPDFDPELGAEPPLRTELLIVDEADRLKTSGLEQLRDYYGPTRPRLILIGMPGLPTPTGPLSPALHPASASPTNTGAVGGVDQPVQDALQLLAGEFVQDRVAAHEGLEFGEVDQVGAHR